eukprot:238026-Amphidinium_carterae.6
MGKLVGNVWQLSGLPYEMDEKAVQSLLTQCQWEAQVISDSRNARAGASSWRVRAAKDLVTILVAMSLPAKWRSRRFIVKIDPAVAKVSSRLMQWGKPASSASKSESVAQPSSWEEIGRLTPWTVDNDPWASKTARQESGARNRSVPAVKRTRVTRQSDLRAASGSPARRRVSWNSADSETRAEPWCADLVDEDDEEQEMQVEHESRLQQCRMPDPMSVLSAHEARFARLEDMVAQMIGTLGQITQMGYAQHSGGLSAHLL